MPVVKPGPLGVGRARIALVTFAMAAVLGLAGPPDASAHVGRGCHHFNYQHKHHFRHYYWERWFMRYAGARRRYDSPGWSHIHVYRYMWFNAARGGAIGTAYVQCPKHSTRPG